MVLIVFGQQQGIAANIINNGLQVQTGADFNRRHPIAIGFHRRGELANTSLIGTGRQADEKLAIDQQHIPPVQMTALAHTHHWPFAFKQWRNGGHLALTAGCAGMADHRQLRHHHRRVFNKVCIRECGCCR
ncbi:hypothetical protein D3C71_1435310 [compost metagenome]